MTIAQRITSDYDLERLVTEINQASRDEANDTTWYDVAGLSAHLDRQDTVFVACHQVDGPDRTLLGIASGRLELKPHRNERWLYVDEVDVAGNQRRNGAGRASWSCASTSPSKRAVSKCGSDPRSTTTRRTRSTPHSTLGGSSGPGFSPR